MVDFLTPPFLKVDDGFIKSDSAINCEQNYAC